MASTIGSTIASFGAPFIPDLADTANVQTALKLLYYGTGGTLNNNNGIYGALYTLYSGNPTLSGNLTVNTINTSLTASGTAALWNTGLTTGTISIGGALTTGTVNIASSTAGGKTVNIGTSTGTVNLNGTVTLSTVANLNLSAGTTSVAPIKLVSTASVVASPTGGEVEFNGNNITVVSNTSIGRSSVLASVFTSGAGTVGTAASTNYLMFPTGNDVITLPIGTYKVDLFFRHDTTLSVSGFTRLDIRGSGTAVGTISWNGVSAAGSATAANSTSQSVASTALGTAIQIGASTTGSTRTHDGTAILRITTAGTIVPAYQHSATQTGTITLFADNYMMITPLSTSTATPLIIGNWS